MLRIYNANLLGGGLRRRQFLIGLGAAIAPGAISREGFAQGAPARKIGWLKTQSAEHGKPEIDAFTKALVALGHKDSSFTIEARYADGDVLELPPLARDLVAKDVA